MARRLLQAVLGDLRRRGVSRVEGFPRPAGEHEDGEVWTGPYELFAQTGFKVAKEAGRRLVVALNLSARPVGFGVLARYLDSDGRITQWPQKRSIQDLALAHLADKIAVGREYSEAEINDLLGAWHTFGDPALLRRELFDYRFVARSKDGRRYWRVADS
jgi:hypothetical protein